MKTIKNTLTEKEQELVKILMSDCKSTGDIQNKLKRLFAGNDRTNAPSGRTASIVK